MSVGKMSFIQMTKSCVSNKKKFLVFVKGLSSIFTVDLLAKMQEAARVAAVGGITRVKRFV
jgi:hypothetical protein